MLRDVGKAREKNANSCDSAARPYRGAAHNVPA